MKEIIMILATTTVEDVERFLEVFGTKGADKRAEHGSKGATVFRDPAEENRMWVLFEWNEEGWANFVSDPEVPPILKEAGHIGKPQTASRPQARAARRPPGWSEQARDRRAPPGRRGPHVRGDRYRAVHLGTDRRASHPEHLHQDRRVEPRRRHALGCGAPRRGRRPRRLRARLVEPV
jgi:quinol monooxygenase YgiN